MKAAALFVMIMALCLMVVPMIAINYKTDTGGGVPVPVHSPAPPGSSADAGKPAGPAPDGGDELAPPESESDSGFRILDLSTGEVNDVSLMDFVRGAVAAEMPASFHTEALKAQAVAAHTFALHSRDAQAKSPDPELKGADFSADPGNMKVYITEEAAREFYGDDAEFYWNKVCSAADSVMDYVLEYDGEPIVAAYHAISAGMTEDASNVWIGSAPYLMAVASEGDALAPGFETTVRIPVTEAAAALEAAYPDIELAGEPSGWFGEPERSASGYVTSIAAGNLQLHGKELRQLFDLRSHNFSVAYDGDFVFTVTGYGHGVGLSQYGADFMARQGSSYDEILAAYYPGAQISVRS